MIQVIKKSLAIALLLTMSACGDGGNSDPIDKTDIDTTPPVIILNGDNPITIEGGTSFVDPGATVTDNVDDSLEALISGSVDSKTVGTYTLTYNANDIAGNPAEFVTRTIIVKDTTPPKVTLNGDESINLYLGADYIELSATALDAVDGNLDITITGSVNTNTANSYTLTYSATDATGLTGVATRTVMVVLDVEPPVITLNGQSTVTLIQGEPYVELGATALDAVDGNLNVTITGNVNFNIVNIYTLTYSVIDAAGLTGTATRTVIVLAPPPSAPVNPAIIVGDKQLSISWDPVAGADSYTLYWSNTMGVGINGIPIQSATSNYVHSSLVNKKDYFYVITASNANGESLPSIQRSAIPAGPVSIPTAPIGLTVAAGDGQNYINWQQTDDAVSYTVYWSNQSGVGVAGTLVPGSKPPVMHRNLTNSSDYYYVVVANNSAGTSVASAEVLATPKIALNAVPLSKSVILDWAVNSTVSYNLYYASAAGFDPNNYTTFTDGAMLSNLTSPYTVSRLSNGKMYYFILEEVGAVTQRSYESAAKPNTISFDGNISVSETDANGRTYLGGNFSKAGATIGDGIVITPKGHTSSVSDFPYVYGEIKSSSSDGKGGWYIGGVFTEVDGVARNNIAHILSDGELDTSWNPIVDGSVEVILLHGSTLYLGGSFTSIDGVTRNRLAAFNLNGTLTGWNPSANDSVKTISVMGNMAYVGGAFTQINDTSRNHIAAIGVNGVLGDWAPNFNDNVNSLSITDSTVYVGGRFTQVNGEMRNRLAAIDISGALGSWGPDANNEINAIMIYHGIVYVGGKFTSINTSSTFSPKYAAGFDFYGGHRWSNGPNGNVLAMTAYNNVIYMAGTFRSVVHAANAYGAAPTRATLSWDAGLTKEIGISNNQPAHANTIRVQNDKVLVGGNLTIHAGVKRLSIAAIEADGTLSDWSPTVSSSANSEHPGHVNAMAVNGSTLYFGGGFMSVNGNLRFSLASVDSNGALLDWDPRSGIISISPGSVLVSRAGGILSMKIDATADGTTVYIAGGFSYISGQPRSGLAAIGVDGVLRDWNPNVRSAFGDITGRTVNKILIDGTTIYAGGDFAKIGGPTGATRNNLAAIGTDGILSDWNPDVVGDINSMTLVNGVLYVGGRISSVSGVPRNKLAAIGFDGMLRDWAPVVTGALTEPATARFVRSMATDGNNIYIGGIFENIDGVPRKQLAAIDLNGVLQDWNPKANDYVESVSVVGTSVKVTGRFSQIANINRRAYANIDVNGQLGN